jgi:hypothetical protein
MTTGKPDSRKTHVTRIFGTNRQGELLGDLWADVERMDLIKSALQVPPDMQWQAVQRKLLWCDDPNGADYSPDGTPSRKIEILKVCDPDESVDDPDEWIPIKVIRGLRSRVETGTEDNGGSAQDRFLNYDVTTSRVVEVRKIVHFDTNIDDRAQAAADGGALEYVIDSDDYQKDTSTKDETQYIDHEIATYIKHKGNAGDVSGIGRQTKLLNQYLIDASDEPSGKVVGAGGVNPPYRLDPYQNIINVSFGGLAVQFFEGLA